MILKKVKKHWKKGVVVSTVLPLSVSSCLASAIDIVRPIEEKSKQLSDAIIWGFWGVVIVVIAYRGGPIKSDRVLSFID